MPAPVFPEHNRRCLSNRGLLQSLVNGQCGGAKNGKCEVDGDKDCAWEKIYRRLEKQGRLEEFLSQPVQVRDYSKVNYKL